MNTIPVSIVCEDYKAMSRLTAQLFIAAAHMAIKKWGRFTVALSGGSTPKEFLKTLGTSSVAQKIDWKKIFFFWSDERFVPHNSADSNFHLANKYLLNKISIPKANIFPVQVKGLPLDSATGYERAIKKKLGNNVCFDWVMLGAGKDGHTASLFPASIGLLEKKKLVIAARSDTQWRISFSFPLINKARQIIVLVSGKEKATVVKAALSGKKAKKYPVQYLDPARTIWILDKEAADII